MSKSTSEKSPDETLFDERGNPVRMRGDLNMERVTYLINLLDARALVDDGAGIEYPVFQCAHPSCAGREFGAIEFNNHVGDNIHGRPMDG